MTPCQGGGGSVLFSSNVYEDLIKTHTCLVHHHLSLNREGRLGTTDDFATSFLHFFLFSTSLWDLPNSRPVHSLVLSSHLFLCLPCLLPLSLCLARSFWPNMKSGRYDHTTAVCVSLRWSGGLRVVQLPAGYCLASSSLFFNHTGRIANNRLTRVVFDA